MELLLSKEEKGNLSYMISWISLGNHIQVLYYDTEKEVLSRYKHLKLLERQSIAIYRCCEVVE